MLELLGTSNLEIRILSTAIAANVLSFSDSLLLTNEEVIDAFSNCMEALLDAVKRCEYTYGAAAAKLCALALGWSLALVWGEVLGRSWMLVWT